MAQTGPGQRGGMETRWSALSAVQARSSHPDSTRVFPGSEPLFHAHQPIQMLGAAASDRCFTKVQTLLCAFSAQTNPGKSAVGVLWECQTDVTI